MSAASDEGEAMLARRLEMLSVAAHAGHAPSIGAPLPEARDNTGDEEEAEDTGDLPADADAAVNRILVLIDFNELLVFRDKKSVVRNPYVSADFKCGTRQNCHKFYVRPGAMEFVAQLAQDQRCEFAIYTSMARHNMMEFVREFDKYQEAAGTKLDPVPCGESMTSTTSSLEHSGLFVFDRPFNARDPRGADHWDTMRDLSAIFKFPLVAEKKYSAVNTVLIESTYRKARNWLPNTMQPQPFTPSVLNGIHPDSPPDRELFALGNALQQVMADMQRPNTVVGDALKKHEAFVPRPPCAGEE